MSKQDRKDGLVYSTGDVPIPSDPPEKRAADARGAPEAVLRLEKKGRRGKAVTVIELRGMDEDEVKALGKKLKQKAGVGGTTKGVLVELQGDQRDSARDLLNAEHLKVRGM